MMNTLGYCKCLAATLALVVTAAATAQTDAGPAGGAARGAYISPLLPGSHQVSLNGIATHYQVSGEGPLLVMLSPSGEAGPAELSKSFTLVAYDVPASGDKPTADHLEALRRYLKREQIDLLGYAQGSELAIAYASRYPERVRKLVLVDSRPLITARMLVISADSSHFLKDVSSFLLGSD
ncbi:alpha/beta fold hydrolase [Duganella sp. FT134W]|uniref:Alpha/beta fold hydrolase n=1 Tax=Duganella margarita TaxID=2692170 RepID=A0A7X4H2G3_9BURK|nr:alpha/beta hydrolase [Duganella margarita]MYM74100.1 alpha/beta fold hydrolase [Duganella margarita]